MNNKVNRALLAGIFFLILTVNGWAKELISVDAALKQIFPKASGFEPGEIVLSADQIKTIEQEAEINFQSGHSSKVAFYRVMENGLSIGYALEDSVIGKWGPIHYLVGLTQNGNILQVVILDYQEIRGRPIAKKRFLKQYQGKNKESSLMLRKDVDGVTGATISSRSLTDGIRKLVHIFELTLNK